MPRPLSVVYLITNRINGKQYVGQTWQELKKRFQRHAAPSSKTPISKAIQKYGRKNFDISVLCTCETQKELDEKEVFFVNQYSTMAPNGYNLIAGGGGSGVMSGVQKRYLSSIKMGIPIGNVNHVKKTYFMIAPDGSYIKIHNMAEFCRKHGLNPSTMNDMTSGRMLCYRGYTLKTPLDPSLRVGNLLKQRPKGKPAKSYLFTSPENEVVNITNLKMFCFEHTLSYNCMQHVYHGRNTHHKGWRKVG